MLCDVEAVAQPDLRLVITPKPQCRNRAGTIHPIEAEYIRCFRYGRPLIQLFHVKVKTVNDRSRDWLNQFFFKATLLTIKRVF